MVTKFKAGDRVRIADEPTRYSSLFSGQEGVVEDSTSASFGGIEVTVPGRGGTLTGNIRPEHLTLIEPEFKAMPTFKAGDRVRIADRTHYNRNFRGKNATVVERNPMYQYGDDVNVKPDGCGYSAPVSKADLTLIDPKEDTFEVARTDLETLEQAFRNDAGQTARDILNKYLHPTVTQTFTVTVTRPASDEAVSEANVKSWVGYVSGMSIQVEEQ